MTPFGKWLTEIGLGHQEGIFVANNIGLSRILCGV